VDFFKSHQYDFDRVSCAAFGVSTSTHAILFIDPTTSMAERISSRLWKSMQKPFAQPMEECFMSGGGAEASGVESFGGQLAWCLSSDVDLCVRLRAHVD
jgi:hypothetical protein